MPVATSAAKLAQLVVARPYDWSGGQQPSWYRLCARLQCDIAGDDHDSHVLLGNSHAHCPQQDLRQPIGLGHQLNVAAALFEQAFRMRGLEVLDPDFGARNVGGDCWRRHAAAVCVTQAVDQMQVARTAATGADGQLPREMVFGAGRKAAPTSWRTWTDSIDLRRLRESVKPFSESRERHRCASRRLG
jgi:hypothetical protein